MRGYERDEYEDYDDYEEDGGEQDEEYEEEEEEEDPKPSKEQMDYLEFRQTLKERIRKRKMKKEGASASQDRRKLPNDNYGSFFGPSKPVIAQRVIQESKSLLENQHLATRVLQSQYKNQKSSSSTSTGSRPVVRDKIPKVIPAVKQKVQKLKDTRDYSFLLSDDAELPAPAKQPPSRNTSASTSEARPAKMPLPSKQASGSNGRIPQNVRDDRRPSSVNGQRTSSMNGQRTSSMNGQRPPSINGQRPPSINGQTNGRAGPTKLSSTTKSNSMLAADKRQLHNNNQNGPGRPAMSNGLQQKKPVAITGKTSQVAKMSAPVMSKPPAAKMPSPALKHNVQQRKDVGNPDKYKIAPRQPAASTRPQMNKPPNQISSAVKSQDQKPKKKPIRPFSDDEDDGEMAINMIRKMFRYNPQKYAGRDDDDSDMEANFDEIMKEEKRSAKIARKEDEEQQRLIEEEERREQMRKMAKKRKLNH
ncbi:protein spt2 [Syzygium oleosum]|uniref:protein spt2 n=1 Tax=Syzygium oleosum TaxID=219896 RepID=UPI0024B92E9B|nr:protein spt2 [Syzygium oleosum]